MKRLGVGVKLGNNMSIRGIYYLGKIAGNTAGNSLDVCFHKVLRIIDD